MINSEDISCCLETTGKNHRKVWLCLVSPCRCRLHLCTLSVKPTLLPELMYFLFLPYFLKESPVQPGRSSAPFTWLVAQWDFKRWLWKKLSWAPGLSKSDSQGTLLTSSLRSLMSALLKSRVASLLTFLLLTPKILNSTLPALPIPPEQPIALHPSTPVMELIPPSLTNIDDIITLRKVQSFQFIPFFLVTVCTLLQAFQMCSWTCSAPWSGIDAPINLATLKQCCAITWLNHSIPNGTATSILV